MPGEDFLCPVLAKVIENNGPQFASKVFESFLQANDIQHKTSTPLWPQENVVNVKVMEPYSKS